MWGGWCGSLEALEGWCGSLEALEVGGGGLERLKCLGGFENDCGLDVVGSTCGGHKEKKEWFKE